MVIMEQLKSSKQEKFSRLIALDGLSISEAYKQSYNCENMKQNSIYQLSCRLSKQVKITSRINELRDSVTSELVADVAWTKARFIKEAEANLSQSRDLGQMNPANTSLQLIGRVTQILEEKPMNQVTGTVSVIHSLSNEVLDQLASMVHEPDAIADTEAIEAESYQILDPEP